MVADADRRCRQFRLDTGAFPSERHRQCGNGQMYPRQRRTRAGRAGSSALSFMVNAKTPILESQMIANVKIAIGGGINEPRDALLTILYGLLTNPDQLDGVRADGKWRAAFEEGVRWVAPIQASSRLVMEDTEICGCFIPKGDTVMTIQASANRDEDVIEDGESYNALRAPILTRPLATARIIARARTCRGELSATS